MCKAPLLFNSRKVVETYAQTYKISVANNKNNSAGIKQQRAPNDQNKRKQTSLQLQTNGKRRCYQM